jgi:hypothetical protein
MTGTILIYIGSLLIISWGVIHIIPTKFVLSHFEKKKWENREIILMEWISEGITLFFIGLLVFLVNFYGQPKTELSHIVLRLCAAMLAVMATWTLITGAVTSFRPLKICPFIKLIAGTLIYFGSYL